jgi:manganese/iron transport system permease protein
MDILQRAGVRPKRCGQADGRVAVAVSICVHEQGFRDHGNAKHSDQPVVLLSGPQGVVIDGRCDQPCGAAGIVLAYVFSIPLLIGAFVAGMFCAVATGFLSDNSRVKQDTVMGIVFSGMFGFGIVLYTKISTNLHLDHILFGNILGVGEQDLWTAGLISLGVASIVIAKRRDLMLHAFDPVQAQAVGLRVGLLHYGLLALISMTIVATLSAAGIILAIGLLIAPGAIAYLLSNRLSIMLPIAVLVTLASSVVGIYASFFIDSAPAPTIILVLTICFIAAFVRARFKVRAA